jgi:Pilus formation protein N terminal region
LLILTNKGRLRFIVRAIATIGISRSRGILNMVRHIRSFICGSLLLGVISTNVAVQHAAAAEPIRLSPGYVSLVKLDQIIGTIVIGNPDVVDATLQGKNTILLTAKKISGSATTNLIVLNAQDAEIFNASIIVGTQGGDKTEIHSKGKAGGLHEYWAYRCMPSCERVKDELETFQRSAAAPAAGSPTVVSPGAASPGSDASASQIVPQY